MNITDAEIVGEDVSTPVVDSKPFPVLLTDGQFAILQKIAGQKAMLEAETKRILEREEDFIVTLAESNGITAKPGITIQDKIVYFPK